MKRFYAFFSRENVILSVYVLISVVVGVQHYVGGPLKYNNFVIFRQSLFHLLDKTNLHIGYPAEYFDIFLYHPTFCILFSPFSLLPVPVSLILWLITCSLIVFYGIRSLPLTQNQKVFFWWFILIELVTSLHNQQTNPIIGALGLFTFSFLERGKMKWASLFPILAFCIKGYGLIFAALFLFYPKKGQYIMYSVLWLVVLAFLPFPFAGSDHFFQLYKDWFTCLVQDHKVNFGFSIMGLIKVWRPSFTDHDVSLIQYAGLVLFGLTWVWTLIRNQYQSQNNRLLLLGYASLWVIMFNHAAESSTYVIAIQGVVLWYLISRDALYPWAKILIFAVFFFSILAPTDVYPPSWRRDFIQPNLIKVIPCFIVWLLLQIQLFSPEKSVNSSLAND
jgi:hypothetical protein